MAQAAAAAPASSTPAIAAVRPRFAPGRGCTCVPPRPDTALPSALATVSTSLRCLVGGVCGRVRRSSRSHCLISSRFFAGGGDSNVRSSVEPAAPSRSEARRVGSSPIASAISAASR